MQQLANKLLTSQGQLNQRLIAQQLVRTYFKNDSGAPFELTDGQADIFNSIVFKQNNRNQIIAPTQYGKSDTIAMALDIRTIVFSEPFGIVTGSQPKSQIIMEKVIKHAFDHPLFYQQLELDANEPLDRIRRSRTREHITWKGGGGIRTFTADARNRQRVKEALTGFGSPNIIEDEASLIPDDLQAMILRMLGGHNGGFLMKIGNPFYRNHFYSTWHSEKYHRIFIDYQQGLKEGRYSPDFIDEMRDQPFFDVLYECKFPEDDAIIEGGYRKILTDSEVENAFIEPNSMPPEGRARLGVDVARGGANFTAYVLRYPNYAVLLEKNRDSDLMAQVGKIKSFMYEYNIPAENVFIDDVGVGGGVTDRLHEQEVYVQPVKEGSSAVDKQKFTNAKAELFWNAGQWIKNGGKLIKNDDFYQLSLVNYKEDSSSRLKIEPKSELAKRGVQSPDVADAFALTFGEVTEFDASDFEII